MASIHHFEPLYRAGVYRCRFPGVAFGDLGSGRKRECVVILIGYTKALPVYFR